MIRIEKIRVVLLVDNLLVSRWVNEVYKYILAHTDYQVIAVVLNKNPVSNKNAFFYRLLRKIDRTIFKFNPNPFQLEALNLNANVEIIEATPIQKRYSDFFTAEDIKKVRDLNPDLILRFGFRILRGDILNVPKYGIWSLHHGDNSVNRGGPPAFWEVALKEPITGVTLQKLTEDLDGGVVLAKAFAKTDYTSFNRNQGALYWSGVELLKNKLKEFATDQNAFKLTVTSKAALPQFYSHPLFKDPNNVRSVLIGISFLLTSLSRKLKGFIYREQWAIGFSIKESIEGSSYRYKVLAPPKNVVWADPFCIKKDEEIYMFAEQKEGIKKGEIICFRFDNKTKSFDNLGVVLKQPYHLSYPFVFKFGETFFMVPETGSAKKVVLYESQKFPFEWVERKVLLENIAAYDATLYLYDEVWYMFASVKLNSGISTNEQLNVYYTEDLLHGVWKEHAMNPVKHDVRGARPAGKIFIYNDRVYRPAQVCSHKYGYSVQIFEIKSLTPTTYVEELVNEVKPFWASQLLATHTFNFIPGCSVIDFQRRVLK